MKHKFVNSISSLFFIMGTILAVLKLTTTIELSWWWIVGLTLGPWLFFLVFMLLVTGGTVVASKLDIDPNSHLNKEDVQKKYIKEILLTYFDDPKEVTDELIEKVYQILKKE